MSITRLSDPRIQEALNILSNTFQLELVKEIGRGTYGVVVSMVDVPRRKEVAVKVVTNPKRAELTEWPRLLHPNVVPLHNYYRLANGLTAFVMPHMRCNLMVLVNSQSFRSRTKGFDQAIKWMGQLLCGINYLHLQRLYHLDIKLGNELISYNLTALLCDFSFLTTKRTVSAKCIGMPDIYRPPEVCLLEESEHDTKEEIKFESEQLDLWGFGILCLEAFTNQALYQNPFRVYEENKNPTWRGWDVEVKPYLTRIQRDSVYLCGLLKETYPSSLIMMSDVESCINFVEQFIDENPEKRKSAREALEHRFLNTWNR